MNNIFLFFNNLAKKNFQWNLTLLICNALFLWLLYISQPKEDEKKKRHPEQSENTNKFYLFASVSTWKSAFTPGVDAFFLSSSALFSAVCLFAFTWQNTNTSGRNNIIVLHGCIVWAVEMKRKKCSGGNIFANVKCLLVVWNWEKKVSNIGLFFESFII